MKVLSIALIVWAITNIAYCVAGLMLRKSNNALKRVTREYTQALEKRNILLTEQNKILREEQHKQFERNTPHIDVIKVYKRKV